ncbi:MAG: HI0074 family nucleotidyltransferase substrate-binding subunit [Alphaproteobacteria bacterium]|nr:HI0074 family nucleotidyltransferase substrate-binding subunit [Alphaproteobacteria bacterium]
MSADKIGQSLRNLELAVRRLKEALDEPETNPLAIDGTIQRFEFVFELNWKTLKRMLEADGIAATTPRAVLREAFMAQWINHEAAWLQMLSDRNDTSHTYDVLVALRVYGHIRANFPILSEAVKSYRVRVGDQQAENKSLEL